MDFIFDPSLVLYLPLYELDGASFASKDAYGHLGTVTGATWRPSGHYFDGTDDDIEIPDKDVFSFGDGVSTDSPFSIGAWIKVDSDIGNSRMLFSKRNNTVANGDEWWFGFSVQKLDFALGDSTSGNRIGRKYSATITKDTWLLVFGTYDGSSIVGGVKLYQNGNRVDDEDDIAGTYNAMHNSTANVLVGAWTSAGPAKTGFFKGLIGLVLMYNRVLTPQEIQNIYLATKWRYR